jgi:phosphoesterase RecJ-like protein
MLAAAGRLVLTSHQRPDGDALGCLAALARAARAAGKTARVVVHDPLPARYAFLFEQPPAGSAEFAALAERADRIVVVDTSSFAQLEPVEPALRQFSPKVLVIDHHLSSDELGDTWRDVAAAAAGVMVLELLELLSWPVDAAISQALLTAILTDTGWLHHANTDRRALLAVAQLAQGANLNELYQRIYQTDRPARLKLLAIALDSLEFSHQDQLAVMSLGPDDFARTGAAADESEDFVNEPLRVASVEVSAILVEQPGGGIRASLRSRRKVDVAAVADEFGGGGHSRAAGFRSQLPLAQLKSRLTQLCQGLLDVANSRS